MALESRLSHLYVKANGIQLTYGLTKDLSLITKAEKLTTLINFSFMVTNDAICQAADGKDFYSI